MNNNVFQEIDITSFRQTIDKVEKYEQAEEEKMEALANSPSFQIAYWCGKVDIFLDPIVGLIPGIGDIISSIGALPALYVALFKLNSIKLTLAIIYVTVLDILCGFIPVIGDIVDIFHQSNKKAARFIVGYVEENPSTMEEINKAATYGVFILIGLGLLLWFMYTTVMNLFQWISNFWS